MELGKFQKLKLFKFVDFGAYLIDDDNNKVLLPKKQLPKGISIDDEITVFVYKDSKDRIISTTNKPFICVDEVAKLTINDINSKGAFLNIGLEKDLLLPYSEQIGDLKVGDKVEVLMFIDKSNRLCATMYTKNKNVSKKIKNKDIRTLEYEQNANKVYKIIKTRFKGHLSYNDTEVAPDVIKKDFGISKTVFKNSIGKLLKDNLVKITDKGIYLYY